MKNTCRELALRYKDDLDAYAEHGAVKIHQEGTKLLFSYIMRDVQGWKPFERQSRGMIVDYATGEVLAWPFEKFFNLGEYWAPSLESLKGLDFLISEKVDGSLGILWRDHGKIRLTTQGSFSNPYTEFATDYWHEHYGDREIPNNLTLLFEIVWHDDPMPKVVKYEEEGLVFIGAIDRYAGHDYGDVRALGTRWGFRMPKFYDDSIDELVDMAKSIGGVEGYVIWFENGARLKLKTSEYLKIFKLVNQVTRKNMKELLLEDKALDWLKELPEELRDDAQELYDELAEELEQRLTAIYVAYSELSRIQDRKEFALAALDKYSEFASFLFALRDDKFDEKSVVKRL